MEDDEELAIPGHVSAKRAARMLGVSTDRIYEFIEEKRLISKKVSGMHMIQIESVQNFKRSASGRARTQSPPWRVYRSGIRLEGKSIQVQIRFGQKEAFEKKLRMIREGQRYRLNGTMLRYILVDEQPPETVHIWLAWKDNEADEGDLERELTDFRAEFADVLDWETERESSLKGLLYT